MAKSVANTKKQHSGPHRWKKGESGNPRGAPKRGESWVEVWTKIGNMTPQEAAEYCESVARQLKKIKEAVTLKEAVALRCYVSLLNEPSPGILNSVQDREEGTPRQSIELTGNEDKPLSFKVVETAAIRASVGVARATDRSETDI